MACHDLIPLSRCSLIIILFFWRTLIIILRGKLRLITPTRIQTHLILLLKAKHGPCGCSQRLTHHWPFLLLTSAKRKSNPTATLQPSRAYTVTETSPRFIASTLAVTTTGHHLSLFHRRFFMVLEIDNVRSPMTLLGTMLTLPHNSDQNAREGRVF